jgi:hypothetical protein
MRFRSFLPIALLMSGGAAAQIPNGGFENWITFDLQYDYPQGWYTLNPITAASNVFTCQRGLPGAEGTFFARITTRNFNGTVLPGLIAATTGTTPDQGFPYTLRPQALNGKWQYQVAPPDQAMISVALTRWNSSTQSTEAIGAGVVTVSGSLTSWADFSVPIAYANAETPDTARVVIYSSAGTPAVNSTISVDALSFGSANSVDETASLDFSIFPSPATEVLHVRSSSLVVGADVLDLKGRLLRSESITGAPTFNVAELSAGQYLLRVRAADGSTGVRAFVKD